MATQSLSGAAPVTSKERIGELDVLRGFALLGVLVANLCYFSGAPFMATEAQMAALPSAPADELARFVVTWLVSDKANTLFAFLFGVGFWVQMQRFRKRAEGSEWLYLRRIGILLVFGFAHLLLLWSWDILHLYALTGFILFAMRGVSDRVLWIGGLLLLFFGKPFGELAAEAIGIAGPAFEIAYSDGAILDRQEAALSGNYSAHLAAQYRLILNDWLYSGLAAAWLLYVLGRFMIGAYVARRGWLLRTWKLRRHIGAFGGPALLLGVAGELIYAIVEWGGTGSADLDAAGHWIHYFSMPLCAAGYACMLVLMFNSDTLSPIVRIFAPVGRMALTNYVLQSFFIAFLLIDFGPGLGLAGEIGTAAQLRNALLFFAAQVLFSHYWLARFEYGPLEWCWRALTYGRMPQMTRPAVTT